MPGVRPSIRLASIPTACTSPVRESTATTLGSDSTINIFLGTLRLIGPISGPGGLTLIGGGTNYFEGSTSNSYAGVTRVLRGTTLLLKKTAFDGAIPGNLIIGDDSSPANSDLVHGLDDHQIAGNAAVTVSSSGLLDLSSTHLPLNVFAHLLHLAKTAVSLCGACSQGLEADEPFLGNRAGTAHAQEGRCG